MYPLWGYLHRLPLFFAFITSTSIEYRIGLQYSFRPCILIKPFIEWSSETVNHYAPPSLMDRTPCTSFSWLQPDGSAWGITPIQFRLGIWGNHGAGSVFTYIHVIATCGLPSAASIGLLLLIRMCPASAPQHLQRYQLDTWCLILMSALTQGLIMHVCLRTMSDMTHVGHSSKTNMHYQSLCHMTTCWSIFGTRVGIGVPILQ